MRICAEEQVFIDGQLLEHAATLGHLAHSHADQLMTGNLVYLVSVIDDGAALYRNEAHDALHRGGLARSVCADERDYLALIDMEADALERSYNAVIDLKVLDF